MNIFTELINRLRHNRGYGVQSPAAFFFVMHVLRDTLPYYAYKSIDDIVEKTKEYSASHCRRLFRITNYAKPHNIIMCGKGKGAAVYSILSAASNATCYMQKSEKDTVSETLKPNTGINLFSEEKDIITIFEKCKEIGLLYIGNECDYAQIVKTALPHVNKNSIMIVEGIDRDTQAKEWWQMTVNNPSVITSMDMSGYGLLFFNSRFKKQHYTFIFK